MKYATIAKILKRSKKSLQYRISKLGLKKMKMWSRKEINYLKKHYPRGNSNAIANVLGRTVDDIHNKASKLKIKKDISFMKMGAKNPHWKGGKKMIMGYVAVRKNMKYILEHRLVYNKTFGTRLSSGVIIHHKDGNPLNNNPSNLVAMSLEEHSRLHNKNRKRRDNGQFM